MNKNLKTILLISVIALLAVGLFKTSDFGSNAKKEKLNYTDFMKKVNDNHIKSVKILENKKIEGVFIKGGKLVQFESVIPYVDQDLVPKLISQNVEVLGESPDENMIFKVLLNILPWIFLIGLFWFIMMRQVSSTGNKAMSFGKSKAKLHADTNTKVTFKDVAGVDEAKEELNEIVEFLKSPEKFIKIGAKIPKGVLLMGSPGTGKTLLAKAIAGEAGVKFFSISGSDFVEMFVGVGASRVRDLFDQGKKSAPCIIFIDEIDAVGRLRGAGLGGGHDEREQTLNQLLVEMDGFEMNEGVIIIAATNRPDVLDPALLRPGRFDRQVIVDVPDVKGREKILAVHSKKIPLKKEVDLKVIAKGTPGFTGADLANLINESALLAARRNEKRVGMPELEEAKDKVLMGPERKSIMLTEEEKQKTAYHEAGHIVIGMSLNNYHSVHKVTIIPRGRALGFASFLPEKEQYSKNKLELLDEIIMLFGGYTAESLIYNYNATGVSDDIKRATDIARRMVCEWGMSEKFGPMAMGKRESQPFLGKDISHDKDYSEATAQLIDSEIQAILLSCQKKAKKLLKDNWDFYQKLTKSLMERETLAAAEIIMIKDGKKLPPLDADNSVNISDTKKE